VSYGGITAPVLVGRGGLCTDLNPGDTPNTHLTLAENVEMFNGLLEKERGSRRWNQSVMSGGLRALLDWFPMESVQRFLAVTSDGKVWKLPDPETQTEITGSALNMSDHVPVTLVAGGQESPGNSRKAFIFSGINQVQVITADGTTRLDIAHPASDWASGNFPRGGVVHRNRLWAFLDHRIWGSSPTDQEQFTSGHVQMAIYPGESEKIVGAFVYRKRLFVFKRPKGVYMLVDDDATDTNWYFTKITDEIGAAGPASFATVRDDMLFANAQGSITSAAAAEKVESDLNSADILDQLRVRNFFRANSTLEQLDGRQMIYYPDRQVCYVAYRSSSGYRNDRIMKIDVANQRPEITVVTKDQVNCFVLRQLVNGRKVPFYGSEDGYIYEMDRADRDSAGSAYTLKIRTADLNFNYLDPKETSIQDMAGKNKIFDFVQFKVQPTGRWDVTVRYWIDGVYTSSFTFKPSKGAVLDDFKLDQDRLGSPSEGTITKKLCGRGKSIKFELELGGVRQNLKLEEMKVLFRVGNVDDRETDAGRI
jgi:hypothetical protein